MREFEYIMLGVTFTLSVALLLLAAFLWGRRDALPIGLRLGRLIGAVRTEKLGWVDLAGVGLIFIYYIGNWVEQAHHPINQGLSHGVLAGQILLQASFAMIVIGMLYWRVNFEEFWGLRWPKWPMGLALILGGFLAFKCFSAVIWVLGYEDWASEVYRRAEFWGSGDANDLDLRMLFLWAVATAIMAPISEEIVFRGYLYPVLKKMGGLWVAGLSVSLLFAAAHLDGAALLPLFFMGLLLTLSYEVSGSLWAPLGIHFLNNAYVVYVNMQHNG